MPGRETLQPIVDAEARTLKLAHLASKAAQPQPKAGTPAPEKQVVAVPPEKPQPKRALSLVEKAAQARAGIWRRK